MEYEYSSIANSLRAQKLESEFEKITDKNVMDITIISLKDSRKLDPIVLRSQLEKINARSKRLLDLGIDYALFSGNQFEHPYYKTAVVTGNLAISKLNKILNEVEGI